LNGKRKYREAVGEKEGRRYLGHRFDASDAEFLLGVPILPKKMCLGRLVIDDRTVVDKNEDAPLANFVYQRRGTGTIVI